MLMSEVDGEWVVDTADGGYRVLVAPGDHLVLVAGATYGKPAADFRHPNVVARKCEVHEFKHYRKAGSKFWTARPGVNFCLVIPKDRIEMVPEKGYSYVPVKINGQRLVLNVSGGGGCGYPGWTDWVRRVVHTSVGFPKKTLKLLADVALSPDECKAKGITFPLVAPEDSRKATVHPAGRRKGHETDDQGRQQDRRRYRRLHLGFGTFARRHCRCPSDWTHVSARQDPARRHLRPDTDRYAATKGVGY